MNNDEWRGVCLHAELCFKGDFPEETRAAYATFLKRHDVKAVMSALNKLVENGQVFVPTPGEIRLAMADAPPPWEVAWAQITQAQKLIGQGEAAVIAELKRTAGELVAGWVATYGAQRLAWEPVYDPDHGGAVVRRLQQSYAEAMDTAQGRQLVALQGARVLQLAETARRSLSAGEQDG